MDPIVVVLFYYIKHRFLNEVILDLLIIKFLSTYQANNWVVFLKISPPWNRENVCCLRGSSLSHIVGKRFQSSMHEKNPSQNLQTIHQKNKDYITEYKSKVKMNNSCNILINEIDNELLCYHQLPNFTLLRSHTGRQYRR